MSVRGETDEAGLEALTFGVIFWLIGGICEDASEVNISVGNVCEDELEDTTADIEGVDAGMAMRETSAFKNFINCAMQYLKPFI